MKPLTIIHWPQVAIFVRLVVPDRDTIFLEVADIRFALQKPQQLVND
jgi:hypothetical protein